jgi:flagellin-like hook-associated protein FlgL
MTVSYIGSISSPMLQSILGMRSQLDDLQRQLGSGVKSTTYAGLGTSRGIALSLHAQQSALSSYDSNIQIVGVRLAAAQQILTGADSVVNTVKQAANSGQFQIDQTGQTQDQKTAYAQLDQLLSSLNTQVGNRYLFSGTATDQPAVTDTNTIVNGDGIRAGLKQIISERNQADLGADGLGRLTLTNPTTTSVAVSEDAVSPFGLKIGAVNSTLSNATVTGPSAPPASVGIDFSANPNAGEQITIGFTLPDGTTQNLTMTATATSPAGRNQFLIGATPAETATNLKNALTASVAQIGATSLTAASAVKASNDFFNTDSTHPPQRIDGPPFDTATALKDGTATDTVTWYLGEAGSAPARSTATAEIDPTLSISYGLRANEDGLRNAIQSIAVFAATSFSTGDPNAQDAYSALTTRVTQALNGGPGQQKISDIETDLARAQTASKSAQSRHQQTSNMLTDMLHNIEGVSQDEVGVQILSLQTSLQASLQTTAMLSQLSLVNFLGK